MEVFLRVEFTLEMSFLTRVHFAQGSADNSAIQLCCLGAKLTLPKWEEDKLTVFSRKPTELGQIA